MTGLKQRLKCLWNRHEYRRRKHGLPKKLNRHWLAGDHYYRNTDNDREPKTDLEYEKYGRGDIVTLYEEDSYKALYEVTKVKQQHGDHAGWDDGRKYNFKFRKVTYK